MKQKASYVMGKIFEDYFSEYQADMISICLEYAHEQADMICVYCSCEINPIYGDFFFEISGKILESIVSRMYFKRAAIQHFNMIHLLNDKSVH